MVDFHASMDTYNREHKTHYISLLEFAQDIYDKYKSVSRVGRVLCISASTIQVRFTRIGVKFLPKGHRGVSGKLTTLLSLDTSNRTLSELAKMSGLSESYIKTALKKNHKVYKKTKPYKWYRRIPGSTMSKTGLKANGFLRSKPLFLGDLNVR